MDILPVARGLEDLMRRVNAAVEEADADAESVIAVMTGAALNRLFKEVDEGRMSRDEAWRELDCLLGEITKKAGEMLGYTTGDWARFVVSYLGSVGATSFGDIYGAGKMAVSELLALLGEMESAGVIVRRGEERGFDQLYSLAGPRTQARTDGEEQRRP